MAIIPAEEKVFMVSKGTNTTYSGSASLKAMQQWYTMQDISDSIVAPYKVFTALLTQNGDSDSQEINSGLVTKGVSYEIINGNTGDFSNVGAPNNNEGTSFIATETTLPNSYGSASLIFNTGAPVATVLENTIGNIWFAYNTPGTYFVNSTNLFTDNKSMSIIGTPADSVANNNFAGIVSFNDSQFVIDVVEETLTNGLLYNTPIEIRVYN